MAPIAQKKRKRAEPTSSASVPPSQAPSATVEAPKTLLSPKGPPKKKTRVASQRPTASAAGGEPSRDGDAEAQANDKVLQAVAEALRPRPTASEQAAAPDQAHKRAKIPGKIRKLAPPRPRGAKTTLSGHRLAGVPSARLSSEARHAPSATEMWVSRKTSFPHYLKKGLDVFRQNKGAQLKIRALGAAIGMAMSVALAIEDALGAPEGSLDRQIKTATETVRDEIEPDDRAQDLLYQDRQQSAVEITLRPKPSPPAAQKLAGRIGPIAQKS